MAVVAQASTKEAVVVALLVHLVRVKTAVRYLAPLTLLVQAAAAAGLMAALPRLAVTLPPQQLRVLAAQVTAGLVAAQPGLQQLMLGMELMAEGAEGVKTPLAAQMAAMVVCKPFGLILEQAFNMALLEVAAAMRLLLQAIMAFPALLVTAEAAGPIFLIRLYRTQGNHY